MNKGLAFLLLVTLGALSILLFPHGTVSSIFILIAVGITVFAVNESSLSDDSKHFLKNIFLMGLLVRVMLAALIYGLSLQGSVGPDALTYDEWGYSLMRTWFGDVSVYETDTSMVGWGMPLLVASVYTFTGRNPFAVQIISCVLGATTAVLSYLLSLEIFKNVRVAKITAVLVVFFPAMVIWTSQQLKEGFIIFFLLLSMLSAWHLAKKISAFWIVTLALSLLGILSLRSYVFGIAIIAIASGFFIAPSKSTNSLIGRIVVSLIIAVAFAYVGVWRLSEDQFQNLADLDRIQNAREFASKSANSGVEVNNTDVRTTGGAITALPMGVVTLMLAPFPWQVGSVTQLMTMPEMIIWWISLPFFIIGLVYTIRQKFRHSISIIMFSLILTIAYGLTQGNLGTIYRQRAQIQVFMLQFVAVGIVLQLEKKENRKLIKSYVEHNRSFAS